MRISHVILDRDGVLNEESSAGGYVASTADWRWIPGAREALAILKQTGIRVSVATNQSGVGRGLLTLANVEAVHAHMIREASLAAGSIDAIFCCIHAPDAGCACRKPAPGLILAAMAASGITPGETLVVGDDLRDMEAAHAAGAAAALVLTGKGRATTALLQGHITVYDDLHALALGLVAEHRAGGLTKMTIQAAFDEHARVMREAATRLSGTLERVAAELHQCFARGNKLLVCGNGGSASDSEHLVAELVGRYRDERRALPALALSAGGTATLTAVSNDYGYHTIFARQVDALALPGDLLFAISTSGNSPNVLSAVASARARGCRVVAFTGETGGQLAAQSDVLIAAPSKVTARIQEVHGLCIHVICESLDQKILAAEAE